MIDPLWPLVIVITVPGYFSRELQDQIVNARVFLLQSQSQLRLIDTDIARIGVFRDEVIAEIGAIGLHVERQKRRILADDLPDLFVEEPVPVIRENDGVVKGNASFR